MNIKKEVAMLRSLQIAAAEEHQIPFTINGFDFFNPSCTVFLRILEKEFFSRMSRNLNKKSLISNIPYKFKSHTYEPHITIGRKLNSHFDLAYNLFKPQKFVQNFTATSVHLLKRNDQGRFRPFMEFPFLSRASAQLSIF